MSNNIFGSTFPSSPLFNQKNINDQSLSDMYAKIEALKAQQAALNNSQQLIQQQHTVFTDIAEELKDLSEDELRFIHSQPDYISAYTKYQNDFSEFLTKKFANEFLQSNNPRPLEELLKSIRDGKEEYKKKFTKDINDIKETNKELLDRNKQLSLDNENLQKQLNDIQNQLMREKL